SDEQARVDAARRRHRAAAAQPDSDRRPGSPQGRSRPAAQARREGTGSQDAGPAGDAWAARGLPPAPAAATAKAAATAGPESGAEAGSETGTVAAGRPVAPAALSSRLS